MIVVVVVVLVVVVVGALRVWARRTLPKGFRRLPHAKVERSKPTDDPTRDAFTAAKVQALGDPDYIVIGSGMGGLFAAGLLAKAGRRVLVLEQHYIAGGCCHEFADEGTLKTSAMFSSGLHYCGKSIIRPFKLFEDEGGVEWQEMLPAYDAVATDNSFDKDRWFQFRPGRDTLMSDLKKAFPDDTAAIDAWFALVTDAAKASGVIYPFKLFPSWFYTLFAPCLLRKYHKYAAMTCMDAVDSIPTQNKKLKAVLLTQFGDGGSHPAKTSFIIHAQIIKHYWDGAVHPVGGSLALVKPLIAAVERAGGRVLVRAPVEQILLNKSGTRALGVRMAATKHGLTIKAKHGVISAAGVHATYERLLAHRPELTKAALADYPTTSASKHCSAFVAIDGDSKELGLPAFNIWHEPSAEHDYDVVKLCDEIETNPISYGPSPVTFIGFPSAKDPAWHTHYPGVSGATLVSPLTWEAVSRWAGERQGARSQDYKDLKEQIGKRLLDVLFRYYPQLRDRVFGVEFATPATTQYYIQGKEGSSYGTATTPERFLNAHKHRPVTAIKGLYLSGQDILSPGVMGAIGSAFFCVMAVLGYFSPLDLVSGRDFVQDLLRAKQLGANKKID